MSDHDIPELDDELSDLFAAERGRPSPDAEMSARLLARVHATVSAGLPEPPEAPTSPAVPSPAPASPALAPESVVADVAVPIAATVTKSVVGLAIASFVAGGVLGAFGHAKLATPPEPEVRIEVREVVRTIRVPAEPVPLPAQAPLVPDASIAQAPNAPALGDAGVAQTIDAGAPPETGRDLGLADENALVSRAQTALARGRAGEALEALSEHQRRFPRGQFTEEREALAIQALARLGRMEQANARAERFRARYPGSMMMRVVDQAVRAP